MASVLTVLLSHQAPAELKRVLHLWLPLTGSDSLFVAYGGRADLFPEIDFPNKSYVEDDLLRVPDQQRNYQSWRGVLRVALEWLRARPHFQYVHLVEYDQVPLVDDLRERLVARAANEQADIVGHHLQQVDGTSSAHYLFHSNEARFHRYFEAISRRPDKRVILSMFPTGSLWTRTAFEDVAAREEQIPVYVELYLPTLAHHLGYRLRDLADQNRFVVATGDRAREIERARVAGAWTLHPVKKLPVSAPRASVA